MRARRWIRAHGLIVGVGIAVGAGMSGWVGTRPAASAVPAAALTTADPSCHSRADCGSVVRGGLRITFTGWSCTTGFVARDASTNRRYVLTAGHCVMGSGLTAPWSHHGAVIGRAALQALHEGSSADVGAIEIDPHAATDEIIGAGPFDIGRVTGLVPDRSQRVGSVVCRSGGTSGWSCGPIIAADVETRIDGIRLRHSWWVGLPSAAGDSGAPVVDLEGRAVGVLIATTDRASLYSTVDGIAAELHLRPCIDPFCE